MPERKPKLKPCPFCGGEVAIDESFGSSDIFWRVQCYTDDCLLADVSTGWLTDKGEVLHAWNRRKP